MFIFFFVCEMFKNLKLEEGKASKIVLYLNFIQIQKCNFKAMVKSTQVLVSELIVSLEW